VKRWTPRRKLEVLHAIATGALTRREAMIYHDLSTAELAEWQAAYDTHGLKGLRTTRTQLYRSGPSKRWTK
jgi:hypothetical protein